MNVDTKLIVSISEANQNFSKVARIADKSGEVYIFKNNKPKYKLISVEDGDFTELSDDEKIDIIAKRVLNEYKQAFLELAK